MTRTWTSKPLYGANTAVSPMVNLCGNGWQIDQLPWLMQQGSTIVAMTGPGTKRYFDLQPNGSYKARFFLQDTLVHSGNSFLLTDTTGNRIQFNDFSNRDPVTAGLPGQFVSLADPMGDVTTKVFKYTSAGQIEDIRRGNVADGGIEGFNYHYLDSGPNRGKLEWVKLWRCDGRYWYVERQVEYKYYDGSEPLNGNVGDLKTVIIEDANGQPLDTDYYRYYTPTTGVRNNAIIGYNGDLMYVFGSSAYARLWVHSLTRVRQKMSR